MGKDVGIVGDRGAMIVSVGNTGFSATGMARRFLDSRRDTRAPASAQENMISNGSRYSTFVAIRASAAINIPMREMRRWPETVYFSDLDRRVPTVRTSADITRYAETGSRIAMKGGIVLLSKPK